MGFVKNRMLWCVSKLLSHPPARSMRTFFSNPHCEDLVGLLKIQLTKVWKLPQDWAPLEFLTLSVVHTKPSNSWITVQAFLPKHCSCLWISALITCDSLYPPACLPSFWSSDLPCDLNYLMVLRRAVDFFSSFSFLHIVSMEWCPLSSLHTEPETGIPLNLFWLADFYHYGLHLYASFPWSEVWMVEFT